MNAITTYKDLLRAISDLKNRNNTDHQGIEELTDMKGSAHVKSSIIGIVLSRPETEAGRSIFASLEYFHYRSGDDIHFYFPGYCTPNRPGDRDSLIFTLYYGDDLRLASHKNPAAINDIKKFNSWAFSPKIQVEFIESFEKESSWKYSGCNELILMEHNGEGLNFENVIVLNLDELTVSDYFRPIGILFEELFRHLKEARDIWQLSDRIGGKRFCESVISAVIPGKIKDVWKQTVPYAVHDFRKTPTDS